MGYHTRQLVARNEQLLIWTERVSCFFAHQVLTVSPSLRSVAITDRLCPEHKIQTPRNGSINGVDAAETYNPQKLAGACNRVRSQYEIPANALVIGFVGRLVRDKGLIELVDAWQFLREKYANLHCLIVGPFKSRDPLPTQTAERLKSDQRIHLTGLVETTCELYCVMDVVALPTYREGLSTVLLEAAAMELPVVASQVTGCGDALLDGITGTLVPVHNAQALGLALDRYLADPVLRKQHGEAARRVVLRDFQPEDIWYAHCTIYRQLLQKYGHNRTQPRAE